MFASFANTLQCSLKFEIEFVGVLNCLLATVVDFERALGIWRMSNPVHTHHSASGCYLDSSK